MAKVQTNAKGKKETPAAVKARGPTPKGAAEKASEQTANAIIQLKKSALSLDVGPAVIKGLDAAARDEAEAHRIAEKVKSKRYDLLSQTTMAIVKAAKADDRIDLSSAFAEDAKRMATLNDQLGLALGFREVVTTEKDKNGVAWQKVQTAKAVMAYFPIAGEDKNTEEYRRKDTLRSNFLHMLKKCARAASAIIEKDMNAKYDAKKGTLQISGSAVKKAFGQATVSLDEKKTIGEGDAKVELSEKPSFTALAAIGAETHGATVHRGSNTRGTKIGGPAQSGGIKTDGTVVARGVQLNANAAIAQICKALVSALEKFDKSKEKLDGATKEELDSAANAIETTLGNAD